MNKRFGMLLLVMLLSGTVQSFAQPQTVTVNCGKKISLEFTSGRETHEIKITLEAGDKLQFRVTPTGDYLNVRAEIWDPAKGKIYPAGPLARFIEPMFTQGARYLEVTTGKLSARGEYTIRLFNHYRRYNNDERAGEYSFVTTCYKKDGIVIEN